MQTAAIVSSEQMAAGATTAATPSLLYWRTRRAMLQRELADRAGVHVASVHNGEHGERLRLSIIRQLAEALEVDPAELMTAPPDAK